MSSDSDTNGTKISPDVASSANQDVASSASQDSLTEQGDAPPIPRLENGKITLDFVDNMIGMFKQGEMKTLPEPDVQVVLNEALSIFSKEPSLVNIHLEDDEKLTICGDIHGQFFDLMNIFDMNNYPKPKNPYLFNGDVVDRGAFSVECILTLLCFKVLYPDRFFIARGNHESRQCTRLYGFRRELREKYPDSPGLLGQFHKVFDWLPLAHLVNGKIFVVHGGLSGVQGVTLDQIRRIPRGKSPPPQGLMTDLLWSDPQEESGLAASHRRSGVLFGPDVTEDFCVRNGVETIVRSHEMQPGGYSIAHNGRIVTIFSAPNYCDEHGNAGAYITLKGKDLKLKYHVFNEVPHPDVSGFESPQF